MAPPRFSHTESKKIDIEITALLDKGALNKVEQVSGQFRSNIFLFPKRDGKSRPVINLKDLNAYIQYDIQYGHFKMKGTRLLRDLLRIQSKGCLLRDSNLERTQEVSSLCLEEYTPTSPKGRHANSGPK